MLDSTLFVGPPLPIWALIGGTLLTGLCVLLAALRLKNRHAVYVAVATWFRYIIAAFHDVASASIGPLSIMALSSIALFLIGLALLPPRLLTLRYLTPIYVILGVILVSGAVNMQFVGMLNVFVKYGFLTVVILCTYKALNAVSPDRFFRLYLFSFLPLTVFQMVSVALGLAKHVIKNGEGEGALAYIGGYDHEANFTVMLATMLIASLLATRVNPLAKFGVLGAALAGIYLANYRTALLAIAPVLAVFGGVTPAGKFKSRDRPFVTALFVLLVCMAAGVAQLAVGDRFSDLSVAADHGVNLIKPPDQYTYAEQRILSGRPHIWAMFITAWLNGDDVRHFLGFGPESWQQNFPYYAHNTLVCTLYEYGLAGVPAVLFLWLSMLGAAFRIRDPRGAMVTAAHLSFILLNMATQPMWMMEGIILYGVLCGYTLYLLHAGRTKRQRVRFAPETAHESAPARPA